MEQLVPLLDNAHSDHVTGNSCTDRMEMSVDLRVVARLGSATAKSGPVSVTATAEPGLQLTGPATVTANVTKEKSAAFGFRATVGANQTSAKVRFAAKTDGDPGQADEVEITLPIFPRVLPRKEAVAGALPANEANLSPAGLLAPDWRNWAMTSPTSSLWLPDSMLRPTASRAVILSSL